MKEILIGGRDRYEINYTQEVADDVLNAIIKWMEQKDHYAAHSGEGIYQDDCCQIDALELVANIVDDILQPVSLNKEED